jgi:hypothetical protein
MRPSRLVAAAVVEFQFGQRAPAGCVQALAFDIRIERQVERAALDRRLIGTQQIGLQSRQVLAVDLQRRVGVASGGGHMALQRRGGTLVEADSARRATRAACAGRRIVTEIDNHVALPQLTDVQRLGRGTAGRLAERGRALAFEQARQHP